MWGRSLPESAGCGPLEIGDEPRRSAMHEREIDRVAATRQPIFHGRCGGPGGPPH